MPAEASSPCAAKEITPEEQVRCSPDRNACHKQRPGNKNSATGTRTRVARVRAEYPNQLDYSRSCHALETLHRPFIQIPHDSHLFPNHSRAVEAPVMPMCCPRPYQSSQQSAATANSIKCCGFVRGVANNIFERYDNTIALH